MRRDGLGGTDPVVYMEGVVSSRQNNYFEPPAED